MLGNGLIIDMGLSGMSMRYTKTGLKAVGNFLSDASRWRARGKGGKKLNEKGFWEGGVIPNTCSDIRSHASFQL